MPIVLSDDLEELKKAINYKNIKPEYNEKMKH